MTFARLLEWAGRFGVGERVELVCAENPSPARGARGWQVVRTPSCLADLPLCVPLELLAVGVERVAVRTDGCKDPAALQRRLELWDALTTMAGRCIDRAADGRAKRDVLPADAMPTVERRSLFGFGRKHGRDADAWTPDTNATEQQRLRAVLRAMDASSEAVADVDGIGLQLVAVGCRAGGQCVAACPHDALALVPAAGGTTELRFDPSLCGGCRRCIHYCDAQALSATQLQPLGILVDGAPAPIATVDTARCERCKAPFVPDDDPTLCAVCAARRANPFGSSLPPEAIERLKRIAQERRGSSAQ